MVIAVKPQTAPEALPPLAPTLVDRDTVVVSIMAGRTLGFLEALLPRAAIVRAMPNTPAAIGRGITVAVGNRHVSASQRRLADGLLAATGSVEWVNGRSVDGRSHRGVGLGAGLCVSARRSLGRAGVAAGLPAALAEKLARETVAGSGELLHRSPLDLRPPCART